MTGEPHPDIDTARIRAAFIIGLARKTVAELGEQDHGEEEGAAVAIVETARSDAADGLRLGNDGLRLGCLDWQEGST
jgi:hypothetical protein